MRSFQTGLTLVLVLSAAVVGGLASGLPGKGRAPPAPAAASGGEVKVVPPPTAPANVARHLQDISVTVQTPTGEGSGVLRKTRDGTTWVWTAGHVVADLRHTRSAVDSQGATKTVVEFDDAKVVQMLIEDGRTVGRVELDAEVVRYSSADHGEDLALLRVRKKSFFAAGVTFYREGIPPPGREVYHCGSLLGAFGASSLTAGIVSQNGRLIPGKVYDQVSAATFPGSSGGGVYLKSDGRLIGLLARGARGGFSLMVPVRRMDAWARKAHIEWAINDDVPPPSPGQLEQLPVEDAFPGR